MQHTGRSTKRKSEKKAYPIPHPGCKRRPTSGGIKVRSPFPFSRAVPRQPRMRRKKLPETTHPPPRVFFPVTSAGERKRARWRRTSSSPARWPAGRCRSWSYSPAPAWPGCCFLRVSRYESVCSYLGPRVKMLCAGAAEEVAARVLARSHQKAADPRRISRCSGTF